MDLAEAVAHNWDDRVRAEIVPLLERFPFNRGQETVATPLELETALHPQTGAFWVEFQRFIAPVCTTKPGGAGGWRPIKALRTQFDWPADMFPVLNQLALLTTTLWDKNNLLRPLTLTLRAEPLPKPKLGEEAVIVAFITSGENSVFGFNQRPTWRTLEVDWFTRVGAQVGLQLGTPGEAERENYSKTVPEGYWALHRLLLQADVEPEGATFLIPTSAGSPPAQVRFSFKTDPFHIFAVPVASTRNSSAKK
jgi:hypothetical protein